MAKERIGIKEAMRKVDEEENKNKRGWEITTKEIITKERESRFIRAKIGNDEESESTVSEKRIKVLEKELERERRKFTELIRKERRTNSRKKE